MFDNLFNPASTGMFGDLGSPLSPSRRPITQGRKKDRGGMNSDREKALVKEIRRWKKAYAEVMKSYKQEQQFFKKEALEYAIQAFKEKGDDMTKVFSTEA
jgi:hypothetical protein